MPDGNLNWRIFVVNAISGIASKIGDSLGELRERFFTFNSSALTWEKLQGEYDKFIVQVVQPHTELDTGDYHTFVGEPLFRIMYQGLPQLCQESANIKRAARESGSSPTLYLINQATENGLRVVKEAIELQLLPVRESAKSPVDSVRKDSDRKIYCQFLHDIVRFTNTVVGEINSHVRDESQPELQAFIVLRDAMLAQEKVLSEILASIKVPEQSSESVLGSLQQF